MEGVLMEITNKEIKGINLKQLITYTAGVVASAFVYFDLKNTSLRNREVMQEYREEAKELGKMHDAVMKNLEQQQRMTDLRLTVIETQLKNKIE